MTTVQEDKEALAQLERRRQHLLIDLERFLSAAIDNIDLAAKTLQDGAMIFFGDDTETYGEMMQLVGVLLSSGFILESVHGEIHAK